ncbi:MAG: hypothetical protein ACLVLG_09215 [Anaerovoracaceae bacterium]
MKRKMIITVMLILLSLLMFSCTESGESNSTSEEAISSALGAGIGVIAERIE